MARTKKIALWLAAESGGFGVDPDSDGSDYTPVKVLGQIGFPVDTTGQLETNYQTGRNRATANEVGADGATLDFKVPVQGLSTAAGDGSAPPAVDWLDLILQNAFGASATVSGEGVANGSTSSNLILDTATYAVQDLMPVQEAGLYSSRTQWRRAATLNTATYTLDRNWTATPTTSAVAYGMRTYQYSDSGGGDSLLAYVVQDDTPYVLQGGRVSSLKLALPAGKMAELSVSMMFDSITQASRASISTIDTFAGTPIKGMLSPLVWGGTEYATKSINIDFGLTTSTTESTAGTNGRSNIEVISTMPTITIEPAYAHSTWQADFRAGTTRTLGIQLGAGVLASSVLNTCFFWAEAAQAQSAAAADDGGRVRHAVTLKVVDEGVFTGTTVSRFFSFVRA